MVTIFWFFDKKSVQLFRSLSVWFNIINEFIDTKTKIVLWWTSSRLRWWHYCQEAVIRMNMKPHVKQGEVHSRTTAGRCGWNNKKARLPGKRDHAKMRSSFLTEKHKALNICELSKKSVFDVPETRLRRNTTKPKLKNRPDIGFPCFSDCRQQYERRILQCREYSQSDLFYSQTISKTVPDSICFMVAWPTWDYPVSTTRWRGYNGYTVYSVDKTN